MRPLGGQPCVPDSIDVQIACQGLHRVPSLQPTTETPFSREPDLPTSAQRNPPSFFWRQGVQPAPGWPFLAGGDDIASTTTTIRVVSRGRPASMSSSFLTCRCCNLSVIPHPHAEVNVRACVCLQAVRWLCVRERERAFFPQPLVALVSRRCRLSSLDLGSLSFVDPGSCVRVAGSLSAYFPSVIPPTLIPAT